MNEEELKKQLLRHEGLVTHAYQDHLGFWTIGVGRLIDERRGGGISEEEAMILLGNDIEKVKRKLNCIDGFFFLPPGVKQALCNMAFQLGTSGLLKFSNMWAALKRHDYKDAAREALDSRWATQTPKRAHEIAEMIRKGE